jgi:hypothetical protein
VSEIFVCKPGAVSGVDKTALRECGIVVVEMDDPSAFKLVSPTVELNAGDILTAALAALSTGSDDPVNPARRNRSAFVDALAKAVVKRATPSADPSAGEVKP